MLANSTDLSWRLRRSREKLKMSRRALAKAVHASPESLRKIETGETISPRSALLVKLARVLNVEVSYFLPGWQAAVNEPWLAQPSSSTIEINLPYQLILSEQQKDDLVRRLAVEFEIIKEQQSVYQASSRKAETKNRRSDDVSTAEQ